MVVEEEEKEELGVVQSQWAEKGLPGRELVGQWWQTQAPHLAWRQGLVCCQASSQSLREHKGFSGRGREGGGNSHLD